MEPYPREQQGEAGLQGSRNIVIQDAPMFPLHYSLSHKTVFKREQEVFTLLPTIVFDHVGKLNNKFSFLIFLTALKGMFLEEKKKEKREEVSGQTFIFQLHYNLGRGKSIVWLPRYSPCQAGGWEESVSGNKLIEGSAGLLYTVIKLPPNL